MKIQNDDKNLKFDIHVGKPFYICDKIFIKLKDGNHELGAQLGEILIGSRAVVYIPSSYKLDKKLIMRHVKSSEELEKIRIANKIDDLIGGTTVLASK